MDNPKHTNIKLQFDAKNKTEWDLLDFRNVLSN